MTYLTEKDEKELVSLIKTNLFAAFVLGMVAGMVLETVLVR